MQPAAPDLWMTAQELAEAGLPDVPPSKRLVNRMAEAQGWRDRAGAWRKRRGDRGGAVEYHVSVLPAAALRALTARVLKDTDTQRIVAVEAAIVFWTEGRGNKSEAVAEAAMISGTSRSSIWRWWRRVEGMSKDERHAALAPQATHPEVEAEAIRDESLTAAAASAREGGLAAYDRLSPRQKAIADGRNAIIKLVADIVVHRGVSLSEARSAVINAWAKGDDLETGVYGDVPKVSDRSIRRWAADFSRGGLAALAPTYGQNRKKTGTIDSDPDIRTLIEGMLAQYSEVQITTIWEAINARFKGRKTPSKRAVQRWVSDWKKTNAAAYLLASDPDAFKGRARLVVGSASERIERLNQRWEMDGTPNDVMLADGKRHGIVGVIDVWSRQLRLLVVRTQTSAGVAACLRKAILEFGVPEEIKMDNGSDYASDHIKRVCSGLEIVQDFCPPFSPEKKPHIERAFRTFSHDLVQLLPGFVGHNVPQRQAIEARKAFATRLMDRSAPAPDLNLTAGELQEFCDRWCVSVYGNRKHGSLGRSPFEQARSWPGRVRRIENERALDMLLMPAPGDGGTRTVTKYGVQIDRYRYVDPALQAHWKHRVQVRLDEEDWGRVLVLTEAGEFICWAICPERAGVSRAEAAAFLAADRKKIESGFRAEMAKAKRDSAASTVAADILASYENDAEKVVAFPAKDTPHSTGPLEQAARAAASRGKPTLVEQRKDVSTAEIRALDDARPARPEQPRDRYLHWEAIDARVRAGEPVEEGESRFWRAYANSTEHASISGFIETYGRNAALGLKGKSDETG